MYSGWIETDEQVADRMARRNAEHERRIKEQEAAKAASVLSGE